MKTGFSDITVILDRSGSMEDMRNEAVTGYNAFVAEQQKVPGTAHLTLILFNNISQLQYIGALSGAPLLDRHNYVPGGSTALLDAVGKAIQENGVRFSATPDEDRPEKVIVAIMTDGHENASKEFAHAQVADMIAHQQDRYQWEFIFLGANIDAPAVAAALNIPARNAANFAANPEGVVAATETMSRMTTHFRTGK